MSRHLELDGRAQPQDRRGAGLRQGDGDAAAAEEGDEHLDGQDGAAGVLGVAAGVVQVEQAVVVAGEQDEVAALAGGGLVGSANRLR
ncbi:hypothetical protein ACIBO2_56595 [Nonomuraea sp. NPDC050022]|uniref:hypothetical protein n=1 Tax=Nonomuraea sp. NPDC050022 TaxID=3364358 RepID=UPI0037892CB2